MISVLAIGLLASLSAGGEGAPATIEYNRDIRPILAENCFACHGPDSASRKADLRLDRREAAIEAAAVAPGDPDSSEMIARVIETDASLLMPPPDTGKSLKPDQIELLRKWVAAGAEYQPHWSMITPRRPELPAVKDTAWVRNPIDRFILARLEAEGLRPAPEADRRTLARRVSLDVTGLPPAPAEVEAFATDDAPDALERYIDRLMERPSWGEARARPWLDAARYADTHGYHFDNFREMWTYRDWVINAFNANMPFDRFTVEQIAGDLLPNRTLDQQIASGFNRCNMTTNEGGTIPEENLVIYMKDRVETTSQVFLGLTVNCAGCHDHKFDPISQKEYYELAAFFNNTTQGALDGNIRDTPPMVVVPSPGDQERWDALPAELADARAKVEARVSKARPEFDAWLARATPESLLSEAPRDGLMLAAAFGPRAKDAPAVVNGRPALELAAIGDFEKDRPFTIGAWIRIPTAETSGAIAARMDDRHDFRGWDLWIEGGRVGTHIVNKWPDDALKVVANDRVKPNVWTHVMVTYDGSGKASGVTVLYNGKPVGTRAHNDDLKGSIRTDVAFKVGQRATTARIDGLALSNLALFDRALSNHDAAKLVGFDRAAELVRVEPAKRDAAEVDAAFRLYVATYDAEHQALDARRVALETEEREIRSRGTIAHVMQEKGEPAMAYVLDRGEYDRRKDPVKPATPECLPAMRPDLPRNRLGLARWLLEPEHPLTARVTVNRFWQELFGQGLVRTAGDLGISGELPSHPELLDWLAVEFREGGWDVKKFYKLMLTSAAYRQSAAATPEKIEADPSNRLLSRGPRFRMDAELIRDAALASSGLLVEKIGGPSVRPYQPKGVWEAVAMPESNTKNYTPDSGEALHRRSLYTFWKRAAPPASMEIFNAPSRETCTVRRDRSNTPLQALVTLNDPQFVEAARALAQTALLAKDAASTDDRLNLMAERLLSRPFRDEEKSIVTRSLETLAAFYADHAEDAAQLLAVGELKPDPSLDPKTLAAWTMLANQLMNLDEYLTK